MVWEIAQYLDAILPALSSFCRRISVANAPGIYRSVSFNLTFRLRVHLGNYSIELPQ
jgi:hypothetical protein